VKKVAEDLRRRGEEKGVEPHFLIGGFLRAVDLGGRRFWARTEREGVGGFFPALWSRGRWSAEVV